MNIRFFLVLIFLFISSITVAEEMVIENAASKLSDIQKQRFIAKLYTPNFITPGENATFRVYTEPNAKVQFSIEYSSIDKQIFNATANDKGMAVFNILVKNDNDLSGKSVAIDAVVTSANEPKITKKAIIQTENGNKTGSNRVYIADKNGGKGFMVSPLQALNSVMMNLDYSENSDFNPYTEQMYDDSTPVYIRNMRKAQDNVR